MAYIPKYILKRLIPEDALKIVDDKIEITFINVISPIQITDIPEGDLSQYVDIAIDGKYFEGSEKSDFISQIELHYEDKVVTLENVRDFDGLTLPVGGQIHVLCPNPGFSVGETHAITVKILLDNPIEITAERTVC